MADEKKEEESKKDSTEIDAMRVRLEAISSKYITTFNKFPLVKLDGITDINKIIDKNVTFEVETRKLQKKLSRYLNTINKMLDAGINAAVLHQHFLGCFNIALQCNDFLCMKIFLSQATSTYFEIKRYIQQYLNLSKDVAKFEEEVASLLKFIRPSIDFSEKFLKMDEILLEDLEKIIVELETVIEN